MDTPTTQLLETLRNTHPGQLLFVTGAGISLASGIPTFRGSDPGALWKKDVTELGTVRFFREDPAGSWQWYLKRFEGLEGKLPNPAHKALVALERWQLARGGDFLLVTQNIDTLHEQAGSERMVKVHGSSDRYRCSRRGCSQGAPKGSVLARSVDLTEFRKSPTKEKVPTCSVCGSRLRMHVLWFDEYYTEHDSYEYDTVVRAAQREAQAVVFIGTSFSVGVTALVLTGANERGVPVFNIDPTPRVSDPGIVHVQAPAEELLVELCTALGATMP